MAPVPPAALSLRAVGVDVEGATLLDGIDWTVRAGERWAVLGPNGSGKTTLLRLAGLYLHPTRGTVDVLGHRLGRVDVRRLRTRIGYVSAALERMLRPEVTAAEVVMAGREAALETWWHTYDGADRARALDLLALVGVAPMADRRFGALSSGERQRVLLARSLWGTPGLVLLDEPAAGLDLGGREDLVARLGALAADPALPPVVLVTHHVEEIPPGFTHALLLRAGRVVSSGPVGSVLRSDTLTAAFGLPLAVHRHAGRWSARAT